MLACFRGKLLSWTQRSLFVRGSSGCRQPQSLIVSCVCLHSMATSATASPPRRALVIDTDAGTDDAQGLAMAFHPSSNVDVLGVVCCQGNAALAHVVGNVCAIMDTWGVDASVPVFVGADRPVLGGERVGGEYWHGKDGFGETYFGAAASRSRVNSDSPGAVALATLVKGHLAKTGQHADVVMLGPLTNLALALRIYPDLADALGVVYIMGGATDASGNVTHTAEFNIFADPEAAAIVLGSVREAVLVTWELTLRSPLSRAFVDTWLPPVLVLPSSADGPQLSRAAWLRRVSELPLADPASAAELLIPDPLCVAAALWPDAVITASVQARVGVELGGSHCRGLTWVDRKAVGPAANVRIVTAVDMDVVRAALLRSVAEPRTEVGWGDGH